MLARPVLKRLYSIAGRVLSVQTLDEWSTLAVSNLVAGWYIHSLNDATTNPDAIIRISAEITPPPIPSDLTKFDISDGAVCHNDQTTSYLDFDGSVVMIGANDVTVWIKQPGDLNSPVLAQILSQAFSATLRRCGLFEFHSGAVVPPEESRALLIAGASGSGKSTITSQLAAAGWSYLSDDTVLLRQSVAHVEAVALRRFFALTPISMAALPSIGPTSLDRQSKERFAPQEVFASAQIESAKPAVVLFPVITSGHESQLIKLTPSESMSRLLKLCPWACYDTVSAGEHLSLLGRLARETAGFDMLAGTDLLKNPHRAADLAYQAYSRN